MTAFTAFSGEVVGQNYFSVSDENVMCTGISPDGRYVVGTDMNMQYRLDGFMMKSYLYDTTTKEFTWITDWDGTGDYSKAGSFIAVSDNGYIVGNTKDVTHEVNDIYGEGGGYANAVAVWKDGKRTVLEFGDFDASKINYSGDGAGAGDISADGSVVVGTFMTSNGAYQTPCKWVRNSEGEYKIEWLAKPENVKGAIALKVSADGTTIYGTANIKDIGHCIAVWKDDQVSFITGEDVGEDGSYNNMNLVATSHNGNFLLVSSLTGFYIYNMTDKSHRKMPAYDIMDANLANAGIDDNGNITSSYNYGNPILDPEVYTHPFWYNYEKDLLVDYTYYMSIFAEGITPEIDFSFDNKSQAMPILVSADGTVTAGNDNVYTVRGQIPKAWVLKIEKKDVELPIVPTGLKAISEAVGQATLTWTKDDAKYNTLTLKSYNIYRDGQKVGSVDASAELKFVEDGVGGHPNYVVEGVYDKKDGGTMLSQKSIPYKASVPDTYAIPFYENFDGEGGYDTNFWTQEAQYGDEEDTRWGMDIGFGYLFSNAAAIYISDQTPHSACLISRPMDATKETKVSISFANIYGRMNYDEQPLDNDSVSLDITTDFGKTWKTVKDWSINEFCPEHKWTIIDEDLSELVAGKVFQFRFRSHGQGKAMYYIDIENVKISTGSEKLMEAPAGLVGKQAEGDKALTLIWKNPEGAYLLNYLNNLVEGMLTLGNEGKPMIAANKFDKKDLAPYAGKYLTGVNTIINFYDWVEVVKGIHASVVVFEDGKLVREQKIEDGFPYNKNFTVVLDEPLQISGDKELKIGIKVYDYDAEQIPLLYAVSPKYITGKSDLYSEDDGATWQNVSEFYDPIDERRMCCWNITGYITDTPELTPADEDTDLNVYNVFRNGEKLSASVIDKLHTSFVDENPTKGDSYYVVAYYNDGSLSEASNVYVFDGTSGIGHYTIDGIEVYRNAGDDHLTINGKLDGAELIGINGVCVSRLSGNNLSLSGLPSGVYMLRMHKDGSTVTRKIMIK